MRSYVFDSFAIMAFYAGEPGANLVEKVLDECLKGEAEGWITVINWGEVFYSTARVKGWDAALEVIRDLKYYPIQIVDANKNLTWKAAQLKAKYPMAYADCFALALAKQKRAALLTGDPEFLKAKEDVELIWLSED